MSLHHRDSAAASDHALLLTIQLPFRPVWLLHMGLDCQLSFRRACVGLWLGRRELAAAELGAPGIPSRDRPAGVAATDRSCSLTHLCLSPAVAALAECVPHLWQHGRPVVPAVGVAGCQLTLRG